MAKIKYTFEEFIKEVEIKNPEILKYQFLSEYSKLNTKVKIQGDFGICEMTPESILKGRLPSVINAVDKDLYIHNMMLDLSNVYNKIVFRHGEFKRIKKHTTFDTKYGIVIATPESIIKTKIIPTINSAVCKEEYLYKRIEERHPKLSEDIEIVKYIDSTDVIVKDKYGECSVSSSGLLKGIHPSIETSLNKNEYFISKSQEVHGFELYRYDKIAYIHNRSIVKIYCNRCNDYFEQEAVVHTTGHGCPNCKNSKGEIAVKNILNKNKINFKKEYSFKDCRGSKKPLPFDFYLSNHNCLIEYDGELHYKDVYGSLKLIQKRDSIKTQYCIDNNIKLIRIPYWDFKNIEQILTKELNL